MYAVQWVVSGMKPRFLWDMKGRARQEHGMWADGDEIHVAKSRLRA